MPQSKARTAVIATGGKQFFVAEGDRVLVPRMSAEPGSEITIERVLFTNDGDKVEVGGDVKTSVTARVINHDKGPKVVAFRYKSKKHVRVHRGSRAPLTAIEIVSVGPPRAQEKNDDGAKSRPAAAKTRTRKARSGAEGDGA